MPLTRGTLCLRLCPPKAQTVLDAFRTFDDERDGSRRFQKACERPRWGWNARERLGWHMSVHALPSVTIVTFKHDCAILVLFSQQVSRSIFETRGQTHGMM
ncbi:hypothetical protein IC575_009689 [Cucumis melo]